LPGSSGWGGHRDRVSFGHAWIWRRCEKIVRRGRDEPGVVPQENSSPSHAQVADPARGSSRAGTTTEIPPPSHAGSIPSPCFSSFRPFIGE
jgi:hypothetical protein